MEKVFGVRKWFCSAPRLLFLLLLVSFATEREARAYTDPGSGALIWQMLVASFVGVMFYFRRLTSWLKKRVKRVD